MLEAWADLDSIALRFSCLQAEFRTNYRDIVVQLLKLEGEHSRFPDSLRLRSRVNGRWNRMTVLVRLFSFRLHVPFCGLLIVVLSVSIAEIPARLIWTQMSHVAKRCIQALAVFFSTDRRIRLVLAAPLF